MKLKRLLMTIVFVLFLIIVAIILLHVSEKSQKNNENITIQVIDEHEYIVTGYNGGITHKVNCKFCIESK